MSDSILADALQDSQSTADIEKTRLAFRAQVEGLPPQESYTFHLPYTDDQLAGMRLLEEHSDMFQMLFHCYEDGHLLTNAEGDLYIERLGKWRNHLIGQSELILDAPLVGEGDPRTFRPWGCLRYVGDVEKLLEKKRGLNTPLLPVRTSTGCYLFLFAQEPIPTDLMHKKLKEFAAKLSIPALIPPRISAPYFGEVRHGICEDDGSPAHADQFIAVANESSRPFEWFKDHSAPKVESEPDFDDGLTLADLAKLKTEGISEEMALKSGLRRVSNAEGRIIFDLKYSGSKRNLQGILFDYIPIFGHTTEQCRIRLDNPGLKKDGKAAGKYAQPHGQTNRFYVANSGPMNSDYMERAKKIDARGQDSGVRIIIVEGEKKTIALQGVFGDEALVLGLPGVYSWRGKKETIDGIPQTGPISDFDFIKWTERKVQICFDGDVKTNWRVKHARKELAQEILSRGCTNVSFVDTPDEAGLKGIDEVIGEWGDAKRVRAWFDAPIVEREAPKKSMLSERIKLEVMSRFRFAHDESETLSIFTNGLYNPQGAEWTVRTLAESLCADWKENWNPGVGRAAVEAVLLNSPALWERPPLEQVNLLNGILDVKTRALINHTPDFLSPIQIPVTYDPAATCPKIRRFLSQVLPEDTQYLLGYLAALYMPPYTSLQKALLLKGEGGNGKSVFIAIICAFLGKANYSAKTLQQLCEDRFSPAALLGKLLNVCADMPATMLKDTGTFKSLLGCDPLDVEKKGQNSFTLHPFARMLCSTNSWPQSKDLTDGFYRKWDTVEFNKTFVSKKEDMVEGDELATGFNEFVASLTTPEEMSGLLNWALDVLPDLMTNGLPVSASMRGAFLEFCGATDPMVIWLDTCTVTGVDMKVPVEEFITALRTYAKYEGFQAPSSQRIGRQLKKLRPKVQKSRMEKVSGRPEYYLGIGLKSQDDWRDF